MKMMKRVFIVLAAVFLAGQASFAQLTLPKNLIALGSPEGVQMFAHSHYKSSYWPLSRYYTSEVFSSYCAVASLVMVLNALDVPAPISPKVRPYRIFTQVNIFYNAKLPIFFRPTQIGRFGMTLPQEAQLAKIEGLNVTRVFAKTGGLKAFRERAKSVLSHHNQLILVNFTRKDIDEVGYGHFSPIGAYDAKTDRFLVLDVARYKYPPTWVKAAALWKAMEAKDSASHKPRGYLILSK